jgi:methyl-accepting chemotaxis protein
VGSALSIKVRILGILGILSVGYLLLLAVVQLTAAATHRHLDEVSSSLFPAALRLRQAEASFEQLRKSYKDAILLEDPAGVAAADKDGDAVAEALTALRGHVDRSPELAQRTEDIQARFASIRSRSHDTYTAVLGSKDNVTIEVQAQVATLATDDNNLASAMKGLDTTVAEQFRTELGAIDLWSIRSRIIGLFMLMVALVGCSIAWWVLQYKVLLPLDNLARRMRDIAEGDGDLTGRVEVLGRDELDEVGRWFNVFIERVETVVVRVSDNARVLALAAQDLAETAAETASQSALQQDQAASITGSMSDISAAARDIGQTTQKAAQDARAAEQKAHAGGETIQSAVATMQQLLVANRTTAVKIEELGMASEAISRVICVIDEIADQTSLLALNASIEAVRAGEHGRGFAVVAVEVRRLAERTSKATGEIVRTVGAMQSGTAEVVEAMRASTVHVESGVRSARSAGDALTSIIHGSEAVQRLVTQIAGASAQQSSSTQSVDANLRRIAGSLEQTSGSSARAVDACDRLAHLAADLNSLVGSFKVNEASSVRLSFDSQPQASPATLLQEPIHAWS